MFLYLEKVQKISIKMTEAYSNLDLKYSNPCNAKCVLGCPITRFYVQITVSFRRFKKNVFFERIYDLVSLGIESYLLRSYFWGHISGVICLRSYFWGHISEVIFLRSYFFGYFWGHIFWCHIFRSYFGGHIS